MNHRFIIVERENYDVNRCDIKVLKILAGYIQVKNVLLFEPSMILRIYIVNKSVTLSFPINAFSVFDPRALFWPRPFALDEIMRVCCRRVTYMEHVASQHDMSILII